MIVTGESVAGGVDAMVVGVVARSAHWYDDCCCCIIPNFWVVPLMNDWDVNEGLGGEMVMVLVVMKP